MPTHEIAQGTPEWHAFRARHLNASDAPAMMGESPYKSRAELIRERATGISADADEHTQRLFDDGHRFEALAREHAANVLGEDLFPAAMSCGQYAASLDGVTMLEDVIFEHKMLNNGLRSVSSVAELPMHYRIQVEHQLMVSGAERCLFMASAWDADDCMLGEPLTLWIHPDLGLRARIVAGWEQFERDVAAYQPSEAEVQAVGTAPETLPALRIELTGMVTHSNLAEFRQRAVTLIDGIRTDLVDDADFANAEKAVKWCGEAEKRIDAAKAHALSQTASIDELFRTLDEVREMLRQTRLNLEKQTKAQKESRKTERVQRAEAALAAHLKSLADEIGLALEFPRPTFGAAIKGLKSLSSIDEALDKALLNARLDADKFAAGVRANLKHAREQCGDELQSLFPDLRHVVTKSADDFANLISARVQARKDAEERAIAEALARAEREAAKRETEGQPAPVKKELGPVPQPAHAEPEVAELQRRTVVRSFMRAHHISEKDKAEAGVLLMQFAEHLEAKFGIIWGVTNG